LLIFIETAPDKKPWKTLKSTLTGEIPSVQLMALDPLLRAEEKQLQPLLTRMLQIQDGPVQFIAALSLAGAHGDRTGAEHLLALSRRTDWTPREAEVLKNIFHGMGIDPGRDSLEDIVKFAGSFRKDNKLHNQIGEQAPDFEIKTLDGQKVKLSGFVGKPVLLHFWSTTCGPCIADFPNLTKFIKTLKEEKREFVAIAVSLDDNRKTVAKAIAQHGLQDFIHVIDGRGWASEPARLYHVRAIPADVVIDEKGVVRGTAYSKLKALTERP
jgi:peroxiredoxin